MSKITFTRGQLAVIWWAGLLLMAGVFPIWSEWPRPLTAPESTFDVAILYALGYLWTSGFAMGFRGGKLRWLPWILAPSFLYTAANRFGLGDTRYGFHVVALLGISFLAALMLAQVFGLTYARVRWHFLLSCLLCIGAHTIRVLLDPRTTSDGLPIAMAALLLQFLILSLLHLLTGGKRPERGPELQEESQNLPA